MTQLWDIIFKLNIHFLIYMESLSVEYLLCECMQASKSCHTTKSSLINWWFSSSYDSVTAFNSSVSFCLCVQVFVNLIDDL